MALAAVSRAAWTLSLLSRPRRPPCAHPRLDAPLPLPPQRCWACATARAPTWTLLTAPACSTTASTRQAGRVAGRLRLCRTRSVARLHGWPLVPAARPVPLALAPAPRPGRSTTCWATAAAAGWLALARTTPRQGSALAWLADRVLRLRCTCTAPEATELHRTQRACLPHLNRRMLLRPWPRAPCPCLAAPAPAVLVQLDPGGELCRALGLKRGKSRRLLQWPWGHAAQHCRRAACPGAATAVEGRERSAG